MYYKYYFVEPAEIYDEKRFTLKNVNWILQYYESANAMACPAVASHRELTQSIQNKPDHPLADRLCIFRKSVPELWEIKEFRKLFINIKWLRNQLAHDTFWNIQRKAFCEKRNILQHYKEIRQKVQDIADQITGNLNFAEEESTNINLTVKREWTYERESGNQPFTIHQKDIYDLILIQDSSRMIQMIAD